jgi:hypothetical protein
MIGESGEPIAKPSVCSYNCPLELKKEEVRTGRKSVGLVDARPLQWAPWWRVRRYCGWQARKELAVRVNCMEFFTWCTEFPRCPPSRPSRCWAKRYVGSSMVLTMCLRAPLWILGSLYSPGGLEPYDRSCWKTSSESDDLLRRVVFRFTVSAGSFGRLDMSRCVDSNHVFKSNID